VVGIDNDMRAEFFGAEASTKKSRDDLVANIRSYEHHDLDIRDVSAVMELFKQHRGAIDAVGQTASQPSHDWAARDPQTDFTVNANGTLNLLEAARRFSPEAPFIFTSTNKVYGDTPNRLLCVNWQNGGKLSRVMNTSRKFQRDYPPMGISLRYARNSGRNPSRRRATS
jgi:CDP-paratose 2-epimerase